MVNKRRLGRTGLEVAEVSLGAWQIGGRGYGVVTEEDAHATIQAYLDRGGDFIDTARRYGASERILGDYFRQHGGRMDVLLASKTHRLEGETIRAELEETLRLLQTDYVDLYYLHAPPDDPGEMDAVLDTYQRLKEEGLIRSVGASIKGPDVTQRTVDLCRQYIRSGRVDVLMVIYSIFRQRNGEMFEEAKEKGVGIVARTALESGFLGGKYAPGHAFLKEGDHRARWGNKRLRRILEDGQRLSDWTVAPPYETLAQVAIQFALEPDVVSSVVVGARSAVQIAGSTEAAMLPGLGPDVQERLIAEHRGGDEAFNTGEDVD